MSSQYRAILCESQKTNQKLFRMGSLNVSDTIMYWKGNFDGYSGNFAIVEFDTPSFNLVFLSGKMIWNLFFPMSICMSVYLK